jgi:hypothetical protein
MSDDAPQVTAARIEVERTRARLMETSRDLQDRLKPKTLAQNAWEGAKVKGADFAEDAVDAARKRPLVAGGIAAGIALFLARGPLMSLVGKSRSGSADKTSGGRAGPEIDKIAIIETETDYDQPTAAGPAAAEFEPAGEPLGRRSGKGAGRL